MHNHPWWFGSLVLKGGYIEQRLLIQEAQEWAQLAEDREWRRHLLKEHNKSNPRGRINHRRRWSWQTMRLDECHRITNLDAESVWTLVVRGPVRRKWGFFEPTGFVHSSDYSTNRRDMWTEAA